MAKKKKPEQEFVSDPIELAALAERLGPGLDNPPVNLDRGSFVAGSLSMGSLIMDLITGGGLPPGKFTVAYGPQGSAKSTLSYHLIASALEEKVPVFVFDHEASADSKYLRSIGVRIRTNDGKKNPYFNYFQPTTGEASYRMMARLLRALPDYEPNDDGSRPKPQALFIVDSLAAMLPEAYEIDDTDGRRAVSASVHSQYMPLIKTKLGRKNVSWFATNQLRLNPGQLFGNPEYQPGGQAVGFYPDLQVRMSAVGKVFEERRRSMRFINISTKKNKQFVPFLDIKDTLCVAFGRGFERVRDTKGYLEMTGQFVRAGKYRSLSLDVPGEFEWNNKNHYEKDILPLFATNEFRELCRSQLISGKAFDLFFKANDWASLYDEVDLEASEDEENIFEQFSDSSFSKDYSSSSSDEEESDNEGSDRTPKRKRKTKAKEVTAV
tara:strand:+ start:583 stop:1893 length:1311 start_codon:yes stop_codon:yes gene_type:complete